MTISDDQNTPESRAAIAAAALVVPTWKFTEEECLHNSDAVEIGRGFNDDHHTMTVHRCNECGSQFVTKENQ